MITKIIKHILFFLLPVLFFSCKIKSGNITAEPFKAIPINAFAIVQLNHLPHTIDILNHEVKFWKELTPVPGINDLQGMLTMIDSASRNYESIHSNLQRPVLISLHKLGNNKAGYIFYCPLRTPVDQEIGLLLKDREVEKKEYQQIPITVIHLSDHNECCISEHDNMLYISSSQPLLEEALRQAQQPVSLLNDTSFTKVVSTAGKKVEGNIFINYKRAKEWSLQYLSPELKKLARNTAVPAEWSAMDLILEDEHLMLSGLSLTNRDNRKFLQVFQQQKPQEPTFISILPNTTTSFVFLGFDKTTLFFKHYHQFLDYNQVLPEYLKGIKTLNQNLNIDAEKMFQENAGGEMAVCYTSGNDSSFFYILKIKDKEKMISDFRQFIPEKDRIREKIANQAFEWFTMPQTDIPLRVFQNYFFRKPVRYAAFLDQYVVFASSRENLKDFLYLSLTGSKLIFNKDFEQFNKNIPDKSNLLFYSRINISRPFLNDLFNLTEKADEWTKCFVHSNGVCLQISAVENDLYYTNFLLQFDKQDQAGPVLSWKCKLDTICAMQPVATINHNSKQTEIMVQDLKNNLYLIDYNGHIIWKKQLLEPIMGTISQIDYFKNNKLQYLFNTQHFLFLIDRNGDMVDRFPVSFKVPASSPVSVVDYDNTHEYRIFVALTDLSVNCLTREGKPVEGWKPFMTETPVTKPVQYFRLEDKDYIIICDARKLYFLNRKGESRIRLSESFTPSIQNNPKVQSKTPLVAEHFVVSDSLGQVRFIYSSGQVETVLENTLSPAHFFEYEDINNDGSKDYLFFDHNKMWGYNQASKLISSINIGMEVDNKPFFYKFDTLDKRMLLFSAKEKRAQVLTGEGRLWNNAAFNNCSSQALMQKINDQVYIFVPNADGSLYGYNIR